MKFIILTMTILFCTTLNATPAQVLLIRHGEKPATGKSLSLKGKERAGALPPFILDTPTFTKYGPPVAIYAQASRDAKESPRAIETMTPLANAINQKINTNYSRAEANLAAHEILTEPAYHGKMVIACFEHVALQDIAAVLGINPKPTWSNAVWDQVWIINFDANGHPSMKKMAQKLLYGDSSTVR